MALTGEADETTFGPPRAFDAILPSREAQEVIATGLETLAREANAVATSKGWNDDKRSFGDLIALMHSELSEALEDYRVGFQPTEIYYEQDEQSRPKPCGIPIEFADLIIRVAQACGKEGIDIGAAVVEKHLYNIGRPRRHGGKVI